MRNVAKLIKHKWDDDKTEQIETVKITMDFDETFHF